MKPIEAPLSDISDVTIDTAVDRASGVEVCHTMLVRSTGEAWALPAADKKTPGSMRLQSATFWQARPSAPICWNVVQQRDK